MRLIILYETTANTCTVAAAQLRKAMPACRCLTAKLLRGPMTGTRAYMQVSGCNSQTRPGQNLWNRFSSR